jgi:hypothetical protein
MYDRLGRVADQVALPFLGVERYRLLKRPPRCS